MSYFHSVTLDKDKCRGLYKLYKSAALLKLSESEAEKPR